MATAVGVLQSSTQAYSSLLRAHPYRTNAVTSAVLMLVGDRCAQTLEARAGDTPQRHHPDAHVSSWQRTAIMVGWASMLSSPFWTWWYRLMHKRYAGRHLAAVAATQAISPPFNCCLFAVVTTAEHAIRPDARERAHELPADIYEKLRTRLPATLIASASVWPLFNYVNFALTPLHLRTVTASGAALLWNVFLSLQNSGGVDAVVERAP